MIDKSTHVYCTHCKYFDVQNYIENKELPSQCNNGCDPYDPEDSVPYGERPNYVYYEYK